MGHQPVIPVSPHPLAWEVLLPAAGDPQTLAAIREEVGRGTAQLWKVAGTRKPAYVVTRLEAAPTGPELVLVLGAGENLDAVAVWADQMAEAHGWTLRTHVKRPGMVRMYERHGWYVAEQILRKTDHGRQ